MKHQYKSVQDVFDQCKGSAKVAVACELREATVLLWYRTGIPEKHWAAIMALCNVTPIELHLINEALRAL